MARTNSANVQAILLSNYNSPDDLTTFINTASRIVDRVVACAATKSGSYTADELVDMESYIAAGLYFGKSGQQVVEEEQTEKARVKFQSRKDVAKGYMDMAKMIDPYGCVAAAMSGSGGPRLEWLGKPVSEQIHYSDRD